MTSQVLWILLASSWIVFVSFTACAACLALAWHHLTQARLRELSQTLQQQQESSTDWISKLSGAQTSTVRTFENLLDKSLGLIASGDPLAYQAIQAMTPDGQYATTVYDPSDEGEAARIAQRTRSLVEDADGSAAERERRAWAALGFDPEFTG